MTAGTVITLAVVDDDFYAVMSRGVTWGSTGEGGIPMPKLIEAGGSYEVGF